MKSDYPVANGKLRHPGSYRRNKSSGLMTVDARWGKEVVLNFLQVGVANAARLHADEDLPGPDGGRWDLFHADQAVPAVNRGVHRTRNVAQTRIGNRQKNLPMPPLPAHTGVSAGSVPGSVRSDDTKLPVEYPLYPSGRPNGEPR